MQLRFQDYLTDGSDVIEQDIVSTDDALAEHRLGAYYNAYRIRLIDALAVDYSALEKYLGREAFENMALDYLQHYPSTHPSVRWFGSTCPPTCSNTGWRPAEFVRNWPATNGLRPWCSTPPTARLLFQLEDMAQVPAEAWPELRFEFQAGNALARPFTGTCLR